MKNIFAIRSMELSDMYSSREYDSFIGDKLGNDLAINDSDRYKRIRHYAKYGMDGSMHSEHIEDWREFLGMLKLPRKVEELINKQIDDCEQWHEKNGSLFEVIG